MKGQEFIYRDTINNLHEIVAGRPLQKRLARADAKSLRAGGAALAEFAVFSPGSAGASSGRNAIATGFCIRPNSGFCLHAGSVEGRCRSPALPRRRSRRVDS
jgi:hypothetical protein